MARGRCRRTRGCWECSSGVRCALGLERTLTCAEIFSFCELPWSGHADADVMRQVQQLSKLARPALCPERLYGALSNCWRLDPNVRATAEDTTTIVEQLWVDGNHARELAGLVWPVYVPGEVSVPVLPDLVCVDLDSEANTARFRELETPRSHIELKKELGAGAFGSVHLAVVGGATQVAVKTLRGADAEMQAKFLAEARLLAALSHDSIVGIVGVVSRELPTMILLELMAGDLRSWLVARRKEHSTVQPLERTRCCLQIARALSFLAEHNVIHRDVAARSVLLLPCGFVTVCSNVLVSKDGLGCVKLGDLGLSRTLSSSPYYIKSSNDKVPVRWMAPESILHRKYSVASDVWSFGVFCWEVFADGEKPYAVCHALLIDASDHCCRHSRTRESSAPSSTAHGWSSPRPVPRTCT